MDYGDYSWASFALAALIFAVLFLMLFGLKNEKDARRMAEHKKRIIIKNQQQQIRFANQLVKAGYPPSVLPKYLMSEFGLTPAQVDEVLKKVLNHGHLKV